MLEQAGYRGPFLKLALTYTLDLCDPTYKFSVILNFFLMTSFLFKELETWKAKTRHHDSKCNLPIKCLGKKRGKKISKVNYTVLLQVTTPNCWSKETYPYKYIYFE